MLEQLPVGIAAGLTDLYRDAFVRYCVCWSVALGVAAERISTARHSYDDRPSVPVDRRRADGNPGHANIDFGGQWVMGRMIVAGNARRLYDRNAQWPVVRAAFPRVDASPWVNGTRFPKPPAVVPFSDDDPRSDDEWLMYWFMGADPPEWDAAGRAVALPFAAGHPFAAAALVAISPKILTTEVEAAVGRKSVGGPLYPPVHGFFYAPLALVNDPRGAYAAFQWLCLLAGFAAGGGVAVLSRGRVWWPAATAVVLLFPGFKPGLDLGQNPAISLAILVWGWAAAGRGRDLLGGCVWGLLAFKPVWAVAFLLVPILCGRWRFAAAMCGTGALLVGLTLPFTGVDVWFDWLAVGREASDLYQVNRNWVQLSRDLFGIPRRAIVDFTLPESDRGNRVADLAGWVLWGGVFVATVATSVRTRGRDGLGPRAAFLALGAFLCCYRFMYYDALLAAFGVAVLFASGAGRSWWSVKVWLLVALLLVEHGLRRQGYEYTFPGGRTIGTGVRYPWDTLLVLALWAACGVELLRSRPAKGRTPSIA